MKTVETTLDTTCFVILSDELEASPIRPSVFKKAARLVKKHGCTSCVALTKIPASYAETYLWNEIHGIVAHEWFHGPIQEKTEQRITHLLEMYLNLQNSILTHTLP